MNECKLAGERSSRNATSPLTPHPSLSGLSPTVLTQLAKLGITTQFDLVLHLPLRYDDETTLYPINAAPPGAPVLVEGTVVDAAIKYRPRRQLVCHIEDGTGVLDAAFPPLLPEPAEAARRRAPACARSARSATVSSARRWSTRAIASCARATPVARVADAGLSDDGGPRPGHVAAADRARARRQRPRRHAAAGAAARRSGCRRSATRCACCTTRRRSVAQDELQERRHPAWRRVKFDELLAQQLSMRVHSPAPPRRGRAARCAPRGKLTRALVARAAVSS